MFWQWIYICGSLFNRKAEGFIEQWRFSILILNYTFHYIWDYFLSTECLSEVLSVSQNLFWFFILVVNLVPVPTEVAGESKYEIKCFHQQIMFSPTNKVFTNKQKTKCLHQQINLVPVPTEVAGERGLMLHQ